ncbi:MAG: PocR ligand-binding domain-containing protein [Clostridia bacterium]|nr:PocR ligand-binding domain-containing protein [Clostridia bacterium]
MNISELERLLHDFHQISGMEVAIVDRNYHNILSRRCPGNNYCASIHQSQKCLERCIQSDLIHLHHVEEEKKLLTYICPFGIFEAIAPIMKNGAVIAYLFFAMGIEDRDACDNIPLKSALEMAPALDPAHLRQCIIEIPHYSRKTLEAYADLLLIMAEYIEKNDLMSDHGDTLGQLICRYIQTNLCSKITLADLSWNLHCSTVTLTEHFKKEFGMTIMQYVAQQRMEKAVQLLQEGKTSITEIAATCGYSDVEYFSRTFKNVYGMSPSSWRRRIGK